MLIKYKGYEADIGFSPEEQIYIGEVVHTGDSLNFHGRTLKELQEQFEICVDDYIEICRHYGRDISADDNGERLINADLLLAGLRGEEREHIEQIVEEIFMCRPCGEKLKAEGKVKMSISVKGKGTCECCGRRRFGYIFLVKH